MLFFDEFQFGFEKIEDCLTVLYKKHNHLWTGFQRWLCYILVTI